MDALARGLAAGLAVSKNNLTVLMNFHHYLKPVSRVFFDNNPKVWQCSEFRGFYILLEAFFHVSLRLGSENEIIRVVWVGVGNNRSVSSVWLVCPVIWTEKVCYLRLVVSKQQDSIP